MSGGLTLNDLLRVGLGESPSEPALIQGDEHVSYGALSDRVSKVAGALAGLGVRRGEVVALMFENDILFVEALLAVVRAGAVAMPVNVRQGLETVSFVLKDSRAVLAIAHGTSAADLVALDLEITKVTVGGLAGTIAYEELLAVSSKPDRVELEPDAAALLSYTSGSTGLPKGVFLTHAGLLHNVSAVADGLALTSRDRVLVAVPLFHTNAQCAAVLPCLLRGGSVVVLPAFDAGAVVRDLHLHRCTYLTGVPAMYDMVADHIDTAGSPTVDLRHVRMAVVGSAPATEDQFRRIRRILPSASLVEGYGLTEGGPVVSMNGPLEFQPGSIGRPLPGVSVKVMESGEATEVSPNVVGEFWVHGPGAASSYHRRPQATLKKFTADGWVRTGDLGKIDRDGWLYFVGRSDDMMNVGGENVFPMEVERVLREHAAVADVCVVPRPHPVKGEVPVAFIVPRAEVSSAELRTFFLRNSAPYAHPRHIEIIDRFPLTGAGKVDRLELARRAATWIKGRGAGDANAQHGRNVDGVAVEFDPNPHPHEIGKPVPNHYHDPEDMGLLKDMRAAAPREFAAWMELDAVVGIDDGAIPRKYRELIAVACAHLTQCVYCMEDHVAAAKRSGATKQELVETTMLAAALRAGAAAAHGALALKMYMAAGEPATPILVEGQ